jgi:hypothetical protein
MVDKMRDEKLDLKGASRDRAFVVEFDLPHLSNSFEY